MLVHAHRDADVVVAQPDTVGAGLRRAGRRGTGVEHVGERDAGQPDHADDRVGVGHRPAAADGELDVLPLDARVGDGGEDRLDTHLHRGLALEPTEGMQAHPDDRHLIHARSPLVAAAATVMFTVDHAGSWPVETQPQDILSAAHAAEWKRDPYPLFATIRKDFGLYPGPVMDYSKMPESMRPKHTYAAVSFDAVNHGVARRPGVQLERLRPSIGLFMGRPFSRWRASQHRAHRNLVSAAFKSKHWRAGNRTSCDPSATRLIDEFIESGTADLVRDFTFEFPTRVIAKLLGPPRRGPAAVPPAGGGAHQLQRRLQDGVRGVGRVEGLLRRADRGAPVDADRGHHRRPCHRRDRRREAQRRGDLLVSAAAAARRTGDHLPLVGESAVSTC